jgi:hypothetical protein
MRHVPAADCAAYLGADVDLVLVRELAELLVRWAWKQQAATQLVFHRGDKRLCLAGQAIDIDRVM